MRILLAKGVLHHFDILFYDSIGKGVVRAQCFAFKATFVCKMVPFHGMEVLAMSVQIICNFPLRESSSVKWLMIVFTVVRNIWKRNEYFKNSQQQVDISYNIKPVSWHLAFARGHGKHQGW